MVSDDKTFNAAKELGKLGASKGGTARANTLTPEERSEIARNAVNARWEKAGKLKVIETDDVMVSTSKQTIAKLPYSMFRGNLDIGGLKIECHVLDDLRRVLTQTEVVRILSGGRQSGNLARYLEGNPLFNDQF